MENKSKWAETRLYSVTKTTSQSPTKNVIMINKRNKIVTIPFSKITTI